MYGLWSSVGRRATATFGPAMAAATWRRTKKADYSHLLSRGDSDLQMLLFETFGGWSVPVVRLFNKMRDKVRDKLSKKQYDDEVSWTTRTWSSLMAQRMSVSRWRCTWRRRGRSPVSCRSRVPRTRRPSSVEGSPTPLPKFASYLARVRLGAV